MQLPLIRTPEQNHLVGSKEIIHPHEARSLILASDTQVGNV